jgi:hypothetical protein
VSLGHRRNRSELRSRAITVEKSSALVACLVRYRGASTIPRSARHTLADESRLSRRPVPRAARAHPNWSFNAPTIRRCSFCTREIAALTVARAAAGSRWIASRRDHS